MMRHDNTGTICTIIMHFCIRQRDELVDASMIEGGSLEPDEISLNYQNESEG
jgi:hypothetical protein